MMASKRAGNRYLAGLVIAFAILFLIVGTLGPARHSPYYWLIVPPPSAVALLLGWRAWTSKEKSAAYSASALVLLVLVLGFSHLLPRSTG